MKCVLTYSVGQCMHLKIQDVGFKINRDPQGCYIFLHFINPVEIREKNRMVHTTSNACFIYTPDMRQDYRSKTVSMLHNYIHFNVSDPEAFAALNLPFNQVFYTAQQDYITRRVEKIQFYQNSHLGHWESEIEKNIEMLFSALSAERIKDRSAEIPIGKAEFDQLRSQIYQNPGAWSVESMAAYLHLSRAYFSVRYREFYQTTPHRDMTDAAMLLAEKLLSSTKLTVSDIAFECGFGSAEYFIHFFKSRKGVTPGAYRRMTTFR